MKPIQERAEVALEQGLRCVQFRLPNRHPLRPMAYSCALGLRYGLIGTAAAFYALEMADLQEERELLRRRAGAPRPSALTTTALSRDARPLPSCLPNQRRRTNKATATVWAAHSSDPRMTDSSRRHSPHDLV